MAINNGNHDFNLVAYQDGTNSKKIKIKFKPTHDVVASNPIVLNVYTPWGDLVFTKTYSSLSAGTIVTEYYNTTFFGELKVHLSTNRGYSYDYVIVSVKITGTYTTDKYTFTSTDVAKYVAGQVAVTLLIDLALWMSPIKFSWVKKVASTTFTAIGLYETGVNVSASSTLPKEGWSIQHEIKQVGDKIEYKLRIWDAGGTELTPEYRYTANPIF